jgi:hypothetical protein
MESNNKARASAKVMFPNMSIFWTFFMVATSFNARYAHTAPIMPTGTLIKNIRCQSIADKMPPIISPRRLPTMAAI